MRNLPQTVESFKSNHHHNDHGGYCDDGYSSSSYNTIVCPRNWPMNEQKLSNYRVVNNNTSRRSFSSKNDNNRMLDNIGGGGDNNRSNNNKLQQLCCYLAEHRARLLLTSISLVFLSIFLVVIYRQFGWIVFVSLIGIISVPFVLIFVYAKRMEFKDEEQPQPQQIPSINQPRSSTTTSSSAIKQTKNQSKTNPPIFNTKIEMENIANEQQQQLSSGIIIRITIEKKFKKIYNFCINKSSTTISTA
ncbi:hypothetical protein DERP_011471 [Dermatophagoides pteronyssinus]|uniref:Uncharacterized protein n=1 Tax=Dermatophagoides pteronyssinus TaxID=6956 RepID=A0ABQ8J5I9_DERPT|nr:hypothetical protein DERP_011471 [Dermatophagoides pteronyssinus]